MKGLAKAMKAIIRAIANAARRLLPGGNGVAAPEPTEELDEELTTNEVNDLMKKHLADDPEFSKYDPVSYAEQLRKQPGLVKAYAMAENDKDREQIAGNMLDRTKAWVGGMKGHHIERLAASHEYAIEAHMNGTRPIAGVPKMPFGSKADFRPHQPNLKVVASNDFQIEPPTVHKNYDLDQTLAIARDMQMQMGGKATAKFGRGMNFEKPASYGQDREYGRDRYEPKVAGMR